MENTTNHYFRIHVTMTASVICGFLVIITGIVSLFTLKDAAFASTCIVTGSGLVAAAKVCNTYSDTRLPKGI